MNPEVDAFLARAKKWRDEMTELRRIALDCGLTEELKWGKPCYTAHGSNVAILQPFKDNCALMFFQGALLEDPKRLLERPGPNSHAARRLVFTSVADVSAKEKRVRTFIDEAVAAEKAGRKVGAKKEPDPLPEELKSSFEEVAGLRSAFEALTPGRQRAYILHFSGAKQVKTRRSRIEKCVPRILAGKGLND